MIPVHICKENSSDEFGDDQEEEQENHKLNLKTVEWRSEMGKIEIISVFTAHIFKYLIKGLIE